MPSDYTTPNYTQPSSASSSGMGWYDVARLALAAKQYQDSKKAPKFAETPLSPEQKAILQMYMGSMGNPALKDNAAKVNSRADTILSGYDNLGWQSPKTFSGDVGYGGTRSPFAPKPGQSAGATAGATPPKATDPATDPTRDYATSADPRIALRGQYDPGSTEPTPQLEIGGMDFNHTFGGTLPAEQYRNQYKPGNTPYNGPAPSGVVPGSISGQAPPTQWNQFDQGWMASAMAALKDPPVQNGFVSFMTSQGIKDAGKIVMGFMGGGLAGAALSAVKVLWDRYSSGGQKP